MAQVKSAAADLRNREQHLCLNTVTRITSCGAHLMDKDHEVTGQDDGAGLMIHSQCTRKGNSVQGLEETNLFSQRRYQSCMKGNNGTWLLHIRSSTDGENSRWSSVPSKPSCQSLPLGSPDLSHSQTALSHLHPLHLDLSCLIGLPVQYLHYNQAHMGCINVGHAYIQNQHPGCAKP